MWLHSLLALVLLAVRVETTAYYRIQWGQYCIEAVLGSTFPQTMLCNYSVNNRQVWTVNTTYSGFQTPFVANSCLGSDDTTNNDGRNVIVTNCNSGILFWWNVNVGAGLLTLPTSGQRLRVQNASPAGLTLTTIGSDSTYQNFQFLLGPPTDPNSLLIGLGCYNTGVLAALSSNGTASSCAIAASAAKYPYFAMEGPGNCKGATTAPTGNGIAWCGFCVNATGEICGGATGKAFWYMTPNCSTGCKACSSGANCVQCMGNYSLQNNGTCLLVGPRVCVSGGLDASSNILNTVECWEPKSRSWVDEPRLTLPSPSHSHTPFNLGGALCIAGGLGSSALATVFCLNPSSANLQWVPYPNLPSAQYAMSVTNVSGVVWLVSGYSSSGAGVLTWLTLQGDNTWVKSSGYMLNARPYAQSLFQGGSS